MGFGVSYLGVLMSRHFIETNPCEGICVAGYGPEGQYCIGCYRTDEERINWRNYSDEERNDIIAQIVIREEQNDA
jgi:predicted Fe-S protein YdhL (DUF1289 family)